MGQVIWTEQAYQDLHAIYEYVAQSSKSYAKLLTDKIFARSQVLAAFPEMGRAVPEFRDKQVRELIEGSYRIIYEVLSEDMVLVQTIWHSSRPLPDGS